MMWVLCAVIAAIVFGVDIACKNRVERMEFPVSGVKRLLGGKLILRRSHNHGAMLGIGKKNPHMVTIQSVVMTLIALGLFLLSLGKFGNNLMRVGLSLLLGGAFANTYDRLKRKYVVDYISFGVPWKWLNTLVFNIADFGIMIGALLAAIGGMQ